MCHKVLWKGISGRNNFKNATFFFLFLLDDLHGLIRVGVGVVALISRSPGLIFQIISVSANTISKDWIKLCVIVCLNRLKGLTMGTFFFNLIVPDHLLHHTALHSLFPALIHLIFTTKKLSSPSSSASSQWYAGRAGERRRRLNRMAHLWPLILCHALVFTSLLVLMLGAVPRYLLFSHYHIFLNMFLCANTDLSTSTVLSFSDITVCTTFVNFYWLEYSSVQYSWHCRFFSRIRNALESISFPFIFFPGMQYVCPSWLPYSAYLYLDFHLFQHKS